MRKRWMTVLMSVVFLLMTGCNEMTQHHNQNPGHPGFKDLDAGNHENLQNTDVMKNHLGDDW